MRLLIDECVPRKLKFLFIEKGHECQTAVEAGLAGKQNGELLALAEKKFDALITIDKHIRYQQNMTERKIAILVIRTVSNDVDDIHPHIPQALVALQTIQPGQIVEVGIGI